MIGKRYKHDISDTNYITLVNITQAGIYEFDNGYGTLDIATMICIDEKPVQLQLPL